MLPPYNKQYFFFADLLNMGGTFSLNTTPHSGEYPLAAAMGCGVYLISYNLPRTITRHSSTRQRAVN